MEDANGATPAASEGKPKRVLTSCLTWGCLGFIAFIILVVVALVVLVPLSMPAVREQSRKVACSNNLRRIYLATQMYVEDHRTYPFVKVDVGPGAPKAAESIPPGIAPLQLLFDLDYIDEPDWVVCPASSDVWPTMDDSGRYALTAKTCSYRWNLNPITPEDFSSTPVAACHHSPEGWNVLFVEGNVEWVVDKEFEKSYRKYFMGP